MDETKTRGKLLAGYLLGRFEGLGEEILAPWVRPGNGMRTQEMRLYLKGMGRLLAGGYGYLSGNTSNLIQVAGMVFPGTKAWDAAEQSQMDIFMAGSDPVGMGLAWGNCAHLVVVEAADEYPQQLLDWWSSRSKQERQFHAVLKGPNNQGAAIQTLQKRLVPGNMLLWQVSGHDVIVLPWKAQHGAMLGGGNLRMQRLVTRGTTSPLRSILDAGWILGHPENERLRRGMPPGPEGILHRVSGPLPSSKGKEGEIGTASGAREISSQIR